MFKNTFYLRGHIGTISRLFFPFLSDSAIINLFANYKNVFFVFRGWKRQRQRLFVGEKRLDPRRYGRCPRCPTKSSHESDESVHYVRYSVDHVVAAGAQTWHRYAEKRRPDQVVERRDSERSAGCAAIWFAIREQG